MKNIINIIWIIQAFSAAGIAILLFSKKKSDFLPDKKYIIFLLAMIIALQLGVRIADWSSFFKLGRIDLGMPGRYFIPNLTAHIILVFMGIGALLEKISARGGSASNGRKYFESSLIIGLILMMAFMFYMIFDVIILRYYL